MIARNEYDTVKRRLNYGILEALDGYKMPVQQKRLYLREAREDIKTIGLEATARKWHHFITLERKNESLQSQIEAPAGALDSKLQGAGHLL